MALKATALWDFSLIQLKHTWVSLSFPVQLLYTVLLFTALFLQHYIAVGDIVVTMAFVLLFVAMFLIVLPILPQTRLNIVNISH